ncbi:hydroxymethylglutaryl-CoA lyase [Arthrobacter sp.]|uniref:hydroxymethylglutaryl-CoA lyase n=1 Tax=Arthrobacter sp. TaxID=1667 RepID=UPI003A8D5BAE
MRIEITDVFLRDGLQDEPVIVPTATKVEIGSALLAAGIGTLETGSFVNPARVPQMADAAEVLAGLAGVDGGARLTVLALNARGISRAVDAGATRIQIVASASPAHSAANASKSTFEALDDLAAEVARHPEVDFIAGVSTAFICPFSGDVDPHHLLRVVQRFAAMGVRGIGLADTLGTTPTVQLMSSLEVVRSAEPALEYSLHLHNANGQALQTVDAAIAAGITRFDAAAGGFGGCPFAPGAAGNLATGELVAHLHASGHQSGIDEAKLASATALARSAVAAAPPIESAHSMRQAQRNHA